MRFQIKILAIFFLFIACSKISVLKAAVAAEHPTQLKPQQAFDLTRIYHQLTTHSEIDIYPAISADGQWIAFASRRSGNMDIWIKPVKGGSAIQITNHRADDIMPSWSPDGRKIVFVSYREDAAGDLWLISLKRIGDEYTDVGKPVRLTSYLGTDITPTFSPDGKFVAFTSDRDGEQNIYFYRLSNKKIFQITDVGGNQPTWSPDGRLVAFIAFNNVLKNGQILCAELSFDASGPQVKKISPITSDQTNNAFPFWNPTKNEIFFSRYDMDTNQDGYITPDDRPTLWKIIVATREIEQPGDESSGDKEIEDQKSELIKAQPQHEFYFQEIQLIPNLNHDYFPVCSKDSILYFISRRSGNDDIWSIHGDGVIPRQESGFLQYQFALNYFPLPQNDLIFSANIDSTDSENLWYRLLAFQRVIDYFPAENTWVGWSLYEIGRTHLALNRPTIAKAYFQEIINQYLSLPDLSGKVELVLFQIDFSATQNNLSNQIAHLAQIQGQSHNFNEIGAEAQLMIGEVYFLANNYSKAIESLEQLIDNYPNQLEKCAIAQLLIGDIYSKFGQIEEVINAFLKVVNNYPLQEVWVDSSLNRILSVGKSDDFYLTISNYRNFIARYKEYARLAARTQFKIGEGYFQRKEYNTAIEELSLVAKNYPDQREEIAQAELILADIFYEKEEDLRAINQYKKVISDFGDVQGGLYVVKAKEKLLALYLETGRQFLVSREVKAANLRYRDAIGNFARNIDAHRGFVATMYALKQIDQAIQIYQNLHSTHPDDEVGLYVLGLCYSYKATEIYEREQKIEYLDVAYMKKSIELIQQALESNYRLIQAYLTLSYNYEAMEKYESALRAKKPAFLISLIKTTVAPIKSLIYWITFHKERSPEHWFEQAIDALTAAIALNNEKHNPTLESELALNLAGNYYNLGEFGFELAYHYYQIKLQYDSTFSTRKLAADVYKRMGHCALVVEDFKKGPYYLGRAIHLYQDLGDKENWLLNIKRQALLYQMAGDYDQSIEYLKMAVKPDEDARRYNQQLSNYRNIAYNYQLLNDNEEATRFAQRALELIRNGKIDEVKTKPNWIKIGIFGIEFPIWDIGQIGAGSSTASEGFTTEEEIALIYSIMGKAAVEQRSISDAINFLNKKIEIYRKRKDKVAEAIFLNNIGYFYYLDLDYLVAWDYFEKSLNICKKEENVPGMLMNILNLASLGIIMNKHQFVPENHLSPSLKQLQPSKYFASCLEHLQFGLSLYTDELIGYLREKAQLYNLLGNLHYLKNLYLPDSLKDNQTYVIQQQINRLEDLAIADSCYQNGLKIAVQNNFKNEQITIMQNIGYLFLDLGDIDKALDQFLKSRDLAIERNLLPLLWRIDFVLGQILIKSEDHLNKNSSHRDANFYFDEAIAVVEQNALPLQTYRATPFYLYQVRLLYQTVIDYYISQGKFIPALRLTEQYRGKFYLDMIGSHKLELKRERHKLHLGNARFFVEEINNLDNKIRLAKEQNRKVDAEYQSWIEKKQKLQLEYKKLIEDLKTEDPELEAFVVVEPVTFAQVQKILNPQSIVINYFQSSQNLYIWTVTSDTVDFFRVPINQNDVEQKIIQLNHELLNATVSPESIRDVWQILIKPVAHKIDGFINIVIVVDDQMRAIPFSYLINFTFDTTQSLKTIVTVPGLSSYFFSYQKRKIRGTRLLWTGDNFHDSIEDLGYSVEKLVGQNIAPLSKEQFKNYLQTADILYWKLKLNSDEIDPLISLIQTYPDQQIPTLQIREFYRIDSPSSLIIVDGVTGTGTLANLAFERVLLYSGAPTLIISLWDSKAPVFWQYFFEYLIDYSVSEAFLRTQSKMKEAGLPPSAYAGYQLIGYEGMNDQQEQQFADEEFVSKVRFGNKYQEEHAWFDAIISYEQALTMAKKLGEAEAINNLYQYLIESSANGRYFDKAIVYQLKVLEIARANNDIQKIAESFNYLVYFYTENNNYDQAVLYQNEYLKLAEKYDLRTEVAGSFRNLGLVYERGGNFNNAIDYFSKAIQLYRQIGDSLNVASCLKDRGRIYLLNLDNYSKAIENQELALKLFQQQKDSLGYLEILQNLGLSHERLANYQLAFSYQKQALDLAIQLQDEYWIALSHHFLANVSWKIGNYEPALRYQNEAQQTFEKLNNIKLQSVGLATQGLIFMSLGNLDEAIKNEQQALELAKQIDARQDVAAIQKNLGLMYRAQNKLDLALEFFKLAIEIDELLDSKHGLGYGYRDIGSIYLQQGKTDEALKYFWKGLKLSQEIFDGRNEAQCLYEIGRTYLYFGNTKAALDTLTIAALQAEKLFIPEVEWRSRRLIGQAYQKNNQFEPSLEAYQRALLIIEDMRAQIKVEEYKAGFIDDKLDVYYDLIDLYLQLQQPSKALEIVERAKSRNFIDLLANRDIQFSGKVSEQSLNQGKALQNEISRVQSEISGLIVKGTNITIPEQEKFNKLTEQLQNLKLQYGDFLIQLKAENSELAQMITVEPLNIDSLRNILPDSVLLIEYFYNENKLFCWAVTNQQIVARQRNIQSVEFVAQVQEFRNAIQEQRAILSISQNLYSLLIDPLSSEMARCNHVVIVPHGIFHYLPFAALMDNSGKYLVEKFSLSLIPSATALKVCMEKGQSYLTDKYWTTEILALGNPNLNNPQLELPFAEKEIESVQLIYPHVTAYLDARATETIFKKSCESPNIILFSCHGEFDAVSPLFSALLLSPDSENDGRLEAYEIFGLKMNAYLVAMSACETGLAKIGIGDEVIGLSRSFIYAGSSSLLSSLWKVDDLATAVMIKRFFRYLKEGDSRARALQKAINLVRIQINVHPAYWAAFNITGDFR